MVETVCKCGEKMALKRRQGLRIGNDIWGIGGKVTFWLVCPRRRLWNFWRHTAPIAQLGNGR